MPFKNNDDMLQNIVFTTPGSANEVGEIALKMGLDGERLNYVPSSPRILYDTLLLRPNESHTIYFIVPDKIEEYQYICTYPGHYLLMKGVLKVVAQ
jgi:azurin